MPIAPIEGWTMGADGTYRPVQDGAVQYVSKPADGDDYTYKPPLIPRQWVPVSEHDKLLERVSELEKSVAELWQILIESGRD